MTCALMPQFGARQLDYFLSVFHEAQDGRAFQDALWHVGLNFHGLSPDAQNATLLRMLSLIEKIEPGDIFFMLLYLRGAFFGFMSNEQRMIYARALGLLTACADEDLLFDIFGLIGIVFRVTPSEARGEFFHMLMQRVDRWVSQADRSDVNGICEFCDMVQRIYLEVRKPDQQKLRDALLQLQAHATDVSASEEIRLTLIRFSESFRRNNHCKSRNLDPRAAEDLLSPVRSA